MSLQDVINRSADQYTNCAAEAELLKRFLNGETIAYNEADEYDDKAFGDARRELHERGMKVVDVAGVGYTAGPADGPDVT